MILHIFFGMRLASQSRYLKVFIRGDEKSPILMVRSGHLVPTHRMMMERPIWTRSCRFKLQDCPNQCANQIKSVRKLANCKKNKKHPKDEPTRQCLTLKFSAFRSLCSQQIPTPQGQLFDKIQPDQSRWEIVKADGGGFHVVEGFQQSIPNDQNVSQILEPPTGEIC